MAQLLSVNRVASVAPLTALAWLAVAVGVLLQIGRFEQHCARTFTQHRVSGVLDVLDVFGAQAHTVYFVRFNQYCQGTPQAINPSKSRT